MPKCAIFVPNWLRAVYEKVTNFAPKSKIKQYKAMENFKDIINNESLTLVDFFATWCGPCKMMHPVLDQLKEELGDSLRILKVDVDNNQGLSELYHIQAVPTMLLFRKGEMVWRQSGYMRSSDLKAVINHHM